VGHARSDQTESWLINGTHAHCFCAARACTSPLSPAGSAPEPAPFAVGSGPAGGCASAAPSQPPHLPRLDSPGSPAPKVGAGSRGTARTIPSPEPARLHRSVTQGRPRCLLRLPAPWTRAARPCFSRSPRRATCECCPHILACCTPRPPPARAAPALQPRVRMGLDAAVGRPPTPPLPCPPPPPCVRAGSAACAAPASCPTPATCA